MDLVVNHTSDEHNVCRTNKVEEQTNTVNIISGESFNGKKDQVN